MPVINLKLNIRNTSGILPIVDLKQYDKASDSNGKTLSISLYDGSTVYTIPTSAIVTVRGTKSDNTGYSYDCTFSGNKVAVNIESQMTVLAGKHVAEVRVVKDNNILGTASFVLNVAESALKDETVVSETEMSSIEKLTEKAEQSSLNSKSYADKASASATEAKKQADNLKANVDQISKNTNDIKANADAISASNKNIATNTDEISGIKNDYLKKTDSLSYEEILASTDYSGKVPQVDSIIKTWEKQSLSLAEGQKLINFIKSVYHGIILAWSPNGCPDAPNTTQEFYYLILKHTKYGTAYIKVIAFGVNDKNVYTNSVSWDGTGWMGTWTLIG